MPLSTQTKPAVSIIILNYNAARFLPAALQSIRDQRGITCQTIVVDNYSTDNSVSEVEKHFPWVRLVKRSSNDGFSVGNNAGVEVAEADLILFMNPDVTFTTEFDLQKVVKKYQKSKGIGLLTARVNLVSNGQIDTTCHRGFPTPWAAFTHFSGLEKLLPTHPWFSQYTLGYRGYDTEHHVDAIGGMFALISREVGDKVGWWDEHYPFYGEDLDFSYRVVEAGYYNLYWPGVTVLHHKGATTGMSKSSQHISSADRQTTRQVKNWSVQAMEIFYRKHYEKRYPRPVTWLVLLGIRGMRLIRTAFA